MQHLPPGQHEAILVQKAPLLRQARNKREGLYGEWHGTRQICNIKGASEHGRAIFFFAFLFFVVLVSTTQLSDVHTAAVHGHK